MRLFGLALLSACSAGAPATTPTEQPDSEDTANQGPTLEAPTPSLEVAEVEAALAEALAGGVPNPFDLTEAYLTWMALGDEHCPGDPEQITDDVLYGCGTEDGTWFEGISEYQHAEGDEALAWGYSSYSVLAGDYIIVDADGRSMRVGGGAAFLRAPPDEDLPGDWSLELGGTWLDETRDDWVGAGASFVFFGEGSAPEAGGELWLDGGVGIGDQDLYFEDLSWDPALCDQPTGRLGVRGPDTWWYHLDLPDDCGTCANVVFQDGTVLGESCVDLAPIYTAYQALTVDR